MVRNRLANGVISHTGTVRVAKAAGCPAAPAAANANCFDLGLNQGSVMDSVPPATALTENPNWATVSMGTSNGWLRNGRTGARRLDLPIVSDGATAVDLIRRPALPPAAADTQPVARQRFFKGQVAKRFSQRGSDGEQRARRKQRCPQARRAGRGAPAPMPCPCLHRLLTVFPPDENCSVIRKRVLEIGGGEHH